MKRSTSPAAWVVGAVMVGSASAGAAPADRIDLSSEAAFVRQQGLAARQIAPSVFELGSGRRTLRVAFGVAGARYELAAWQAARPAAEAAGAKQVQMGPALDLTRELQRFARISATGVPEPLDTVDYRACEIDYRLAVSHQIEGAQVRAVATASSDTQLIGPPAPIPAMLTFIAQAAVYQPATHTWFNQSQRFDGPVGFVAADTGWVPASCTWTTERALSGSQACPGSFRSVLSGENTCQ